MQGYPEIGDLQQSTAEQQDEVQITKQVIQQEHKEEILKPQAFTHQLKFEPPPMELQFTSPIHYNKQPTPYVPPPMPIPQVKSLGGIFQMLKDYTAENYRIIIFILITIIIIWLVIMNMDKIKKFIYKLRGKEKYQILNLNGKIIESYLEKDDNKKYYQQTVIDGVKQPPVYQLQDDGSLNSEFTLKPEINSNQLNNIIITDNTEQLYDGGQIKFGMRENFSSIKMSSKKEFMRSGSQFPAVQQKRENYGTVYTMEDYNANIAESDLMTGMFEQTIEQTARKDLIFDNQVIQDMYETRQTTNLKPEITIHDIGVFEMIQRQNQVNDYMTTMQETQKGVAITMSQNPEHVELFVRKVSQGYVPVTQHVNELNVAFALQKSAEGFAGINQGVIQQLAGRLTNRENYHFLATNDAIRGNIPREQFLAFLAKKDVYNALLASNQLSQTEYDKCKKYAISLLTTAGDYYNLPQKEQQEYLDILVAAMKNKIENKIPQSYTELAGGTELLITVFPKNALFSPFMVKNVSSFVRKINKMNLAQLQSLLQ